MAQPVEYLSDDQIRAEAEQFLREHHANGATPVPIEEIVEFELGIEIIPFRGLRDRFSIDGYLSNDLRTITVDEAIMERIPSRYRFTLAHEIGHLMLHADFIRASSPQDTVQWKAAIQNIPPKDYSRLEFQAYHFAGCILVPRTALLAAWQEAATLAEERGLDLAELGDIGIEQVAGWIAKQFQVSTQVITRCLKHDGLTDPT